MMSQNFKTRVRGAGANHMAGFDHLTSQCDEILMLIFSSLDGKSVLRLAQTCRKLHKICTYDQHLWSRLCLVDFAIGLLSPQPFSCFRHLYKCIYESREILKFYLSDEYQEYGNNRYGVFPSWLWSWVVFNTNPPLLPEWIRNYHEPFLRYKMSEISLGKTLKVWCLKSADLPEHIVTRVEYGTSYYRWRDIQVAAMRVHGGPKGLEKFMLRRCWRSRGYVERAFERIRNGTFILPNKCGESSAQFAQATHSMQIAELFAQIANASRQIGSGSGSVAQPPRNVAYGSISIGNGAGQSARISARVLNASNNIVHVAGQLGHRSGQVDNGSGQVAHASGQVGHGSGQVAHGHGQVGHGTGQASRGPGQFSHASMLVAHGIGQAGHAMGRSDHAFEQIAHGSRQIEDESLQNARGSAEVGESSQQSARSVRYVFSSSSSSSMDSE